MFTHNKLVFTFRGFFICVNLGENQSRNVTVRVCTDGQRHRRKLVLLADRTIGRAFGTVCRLSVYRLSSVTFCIVAKRYVLAKNCLKE